MEVSLNTKSKDETIKLGEFVSKFLNLGDVITLEGDLGAGKTTFVKGVGKALGVEEEINSPTFNILKCYFVKPLPLYHIDAYRLEGVNKENKNIGLEEVIEGDGVCLIEWPHYIDEFINYDLTLDIDIRMVEGDVRRITFMSNNEHFKELFLSLKDYKNE